MYAAKLEQTLARKSLFNVGCPILRGCYKSLSHRTNNSDGFPAFGVAGRGSGRAPVIFQLNQMTIIQVIIDSMPQIRPSFVVVRAVATHCKRLFH
eukprot:1390046-Amphidinium_carterae.1